MPIFLKNAFRLGLLLLFFIGKNVLSQQDLNNFKILQSQGSIPQDFIVKSALKVESDMKTERENLSSKEKKIFLEGIHYGVDELLQSGLVIYGDEISKYVSRIAQKLLEKDKALFGQLRFYTIKSNVSNALSTDQGIVFVTTGLISQLTSEAQLAFILAHEISHFTEKHVIETYQYTTRNQGMNNQIIQMSTYSKDKEFEADVLGVDLYYKAGYSKKHLTSTFDVLMYSYLPIDEIELPVTYFNSELCFIPMTKFPTKKYPIQAEEAYDDSRSTHPNIQKRKEKVLEAAITKPNWGEVESFFGKIDFEYTRNLSRFERLRSDIIDSRYADALYTIFILEKSFPNSLYIHRMKAQCWLGLSSFKIGGSINETIDSKSDLEGEGAAMHDFIRSLNEKELTALAMRNIEDSRKKFPADQEINAIWSRQIKNLISTKIQLTQLSKTNFQTSIDNWNKRDTLTADSLNTNNDKTLTKYDKIKKKKNEITDGQVDSTLYYLYNLSDLCTNDTFVEKFNEIKRNQDKIEEEESSYYSLSRSERKKIDDEKNRTDISDFILVEPAAISYKKGNVDYAGSDQLEVKFKESFDYVTKKLDLKMQTVGKGNLSDLGTDGFNEKSFFTSLLIQLSNNNELDIFPVDYSYLEQIKDRYGTSKLVFSIIEHTYNPRFSPAAAALIIFPPVFLGYLPLPFISGNRTELNLIVLDISESKIANGASYSFREPVSKKGIQARVYDILSSINTKK